MAIQNRFRKWRVLPIWLFASLLPGRLRPARLTAQEIPHLDRKPSSTQLIVDGQPFVIFGGELGNSSAGTPAEADRILPRLARVHINTVLMPVSWDQLEPVEGKFDFAILDHWIEQARAQHLHLVLLWFGSWKNAFSSYAPNWVKKDPNRFLRAVSPDGHPLEILSTLSKENLDADARVFRALMHHLREFDAQQHTVLMVQIENEVGILGSSRDHSAEADRLMAGPIPDTLRQALRAHREWFQPDESNRPLNPDGHSWRDVFGDYAPEAFMAWNYARYIGQVAAAGKTEYPLPMFVNAQLPAPQERAGEYPSGGPHPRNLEIYRTAAPALDFFSPDIYWPNFEDWLQRYSARDNPLFVPEAKLEQAPFNAFYAYGARAFGFSPFAVENLPDVDAEADESKNPLAQSYAVLQQIDDLLPTAQREDRTRGLMLHASSPRPSQTVALGGYLFTAGLPRSWPAKNLLQDDGAMLLLETGPDEFLIAGTALSVSVSVDPEGKSGIAGIASVEEGSRVRGKWLTVSRLSGDQTNQGRSILLPDHRCTLLRVQLYTIPSR